MKNENEVAAYADGLKHGYALGYESGYSEGVVDAAFETET